MPQIISTPSYIHSGGTLIRGKYVTRATEWSGVAPSVTDAVCLVSVGRHWGASAHFSPALQSGCCLVVLDSVPTAKLSINLVNLLNIWSQIGWSTSKNQLLFANVTGGPIF